MPRRIKLILEYEGGAFHGWQKQIAPSKTRTVQGELESALRKLTGLSIPTFGASRTDAGVHAAAQTVSFDLLDSVRLPILRLPPALNAHLPDDVSVLAAAEAAPDFHARLSAKGKHYRYRVLNRRQRPALRRSWQWHIPFPLDVAAMRAASIGILGKHDFAAFAGDLPARRKQRRAEGRELSTVRELRRLEILAVPLASVDEDAPSNPTDRWPPAKITFDLEGDGFLYRMVRNLVGSLVEIGRGKHPPQWLAEVLESKDRRRAGPSAPPEGLCLMRVFY